MALITFIKDSNHGSTLIFLGITDFAGKPRPEGLGCRASEVRERTHPTEGGA